MSQTEKSQKHLPDFLVQYIDTRLAKISLHRGAVKELAQAIQILSDYYTSHERTSTDWQSSSTVAAYLSYFLPLHWQRNRRVLEQGSQVDFFSGFERIVDVGAGLGTSRAAFFDVFPSAAWSYLAYDPHIPTAMRWHNESFSPQTHWLEQLTVKPGKLTLAVLSYALNEMDHFNLAAWDWADGFMFIEPALAKDARRLMALRDQLIQAGFHIWAPCTHQTACPLLKHSRHDWCHDEVWWQLPDWLAAIHKRLPMQNERLPLSYLLARRDRKSNKSGLWRIIGDQQREKGKTRQLVCRGEQREFISWLKRDGEPDELSRGDLVVAPLETVLVKGGGELRMQSKLHQFGSKE